MWIISSTLSLSTEKLAAPAKPPGSTVVCVHAVFGGPKTRGPKNHHGTQRIHRRQHVVTQSVCFRCVCCNPCTHVCSLLVFVTQLCLLACFTRWSPDSQRTCRYLFHRRRLLSKQTRFLVQVRVAVPGARSMRALVVACLFLRINSVVLAVATFLPCAICQVPRGQQARFWSQKISPFP